MKKILVSISAFAFVMLTMFPGSAQAGHTYSRNKTGGLVIGPVTFNVTLDSVADLNCNPGEDDYWYIGAYDPTNDVEYYPSLSDIHPTSQLSAQTTISFPALTPIGEVWTACLTSNTSFASENGSLRLEFDSDGTLFFVLI